jgi:phosphohistidine phosphatase
VKRLYLIRHAKSSWAEPGLRDFDRPLNDRGKLDAPFMGKKLAKDGILPDLILASPAKRTRKTAQRIAEAVGYPQTDILYDQAIYEAEVPSLLQVLASVPDDINELFLVGHNYAITDLAEYLTGQPIGNIPTCGIVLVEFHNESWRELQAGSGRMLFFDFPKKHDRRD